MPVDTTTPSVQYRDSAIQDMMGRPPGWLLRSGIGVVTVSVAVLLGLTALISYPERVEAPFVLQTETVPLAVNASAPNYVDTLLKEDLATVIPGDTLLVFRSDGDWRTVRPLYNYLTEAKGKEPDALAVILVRDYPATLSSVVGQFNATLRATHSYMRTNGVAAQAAAIRQEISQAENLSASLERQVAIYDKELGYKAMSVERARAMTADSLMSQQEAEGIEEQTLTAQRQREVLVAGDVQNQLRITQLNQQILRLQLDHQERRAEFARQLRQQLQALRAALDEFDLRYFIVAREAGVIDWTPDVRKDALVGGSAPLGYLLPDESSSQKVARLALPPAGSGRVALGDRVILELDAFPSRQYGQVNGTLVAVDAVALPDQDRQFGRQATVELADTLRTSYDVKVPFQYNLTGMARIITKERTLLQRLTDQLFNLTQNQ